MSHLDETGSAVEITDITDSAQFPTYRQHVVVGEFERTDKLKTDETQKAKTEQTTLTALQESVWVFLHLKFTQCWNNYLLVAKCLIVKYYLAF